jgi:hypothetical protein
MPKLQNVFYPDLNYFCRKYLVTGEQLTPADTLLFPQRFKEQEASIFEQLLLFDSISFKVHGENIPLAVLFHILGESALEALMEQRALHFVLWTPQVLYMKSEIPGVNPIAYGNLNSPPHCDPEKSIELGLNWIRNPPSKRLKRRLVKKIGPLYELPAKELAGKAVEITNSSYNSGKLLSYGLSPLLKPLDKLAERERSILCDCATELLEYSFLMERGMTSFSKYRYFDLFSGSVQKIKEASDIPLRFNALARLEGFPNLKALHDQLDNGLREVPKLRIKRSSVKFREWLASAESSEAGLEITREYVDSIANAKGLFDSARGKFTKSVLMTGVGAGVGAAIGGSLEGAAWGAGVSKILEPLADLGLDLLDAFLLEGLTKGWTPRMFFDDLEKINAKHTK